MRTLYRKQFLILLLILSGSAYCEEPQAPVDKAKNTQASDDSKKDAETDASEKVAVSSDKNIYKGDRLSFHVDLKAKAVNTLDGKLLVDDVCVPAGTTLRVISDFTDGSVIALPNNKFGDVTDCINKNTSIENNPILVTKMQINTFYPNRYGFTFGALMVPYKYHYSGSKDFSGGATLSPYFGYRFDKNILGVEIKPILFAGMTKVDVTQNVNGESTTQSLAGFSYGGGFLGEIKDSFQVGVVVGKDRVNDSSSYSDNGKTWVSLAIGFSFSN
ncbi:MAG TPA: hypothetical protein VGE32_09730 [Cellvibrio sp.]